MMPDLNLLKLLALYAESSPIRLSTSLLVLVCLFSTGLSRKRCNLAPSALDCCFLTLIIHCLNAFPICLLFLVSVADSFLSVCVCVCAVLCHALSSLRNRGPGAPCFEKATHDAID
eukprot:gnl/Trimastix_PCT/1554.p2 GENE.gnl/Trimastix_PCT/1554~~gnl/Trimastix_PCT/1554.p2  ORF type:complete len:116 (+),score=9.66 gnl/Trimastix_PCT/1554:129-476(+)